MTAFPSLVPSSRTFTPGEYPATAFAGYTGAQSRVRHSNIFINAQLRLTFLGLTQPQMLDIWNHYNGRRGEFRSFDLPAEVVSYGSITDYVPGDYLWRYAGPGSVEDLPCGGHNVSLTLETVPPVAASVVGADLLLLHMDGGNGSTVFTDSGPSALTVTANGNAQISTAQSKFGGAAGLFDGAGDYLSISDPSLAIGTGDFTIEAWVRPAALIAYQGVCLFPYLQDTGLYIYQDFGANDLKLLWYESPAAAGPESTGSIPLNSWSHIAVVRQSGTVSLYINGVKQPSTYSSQVSLNQSSVTIGAYVPFGEYFQGYMDEFRATDRVVYTASFTPPAAPFPDA